MKQPILAIGVGGVGSKLAVNSSKILGCRCLLISNDNKDLQESQKSIFIDSHSCINPSTYRLRSIAESSAKNIRKALEGYGTVIVFANLAGKAGIAIAPIVCREATSAGSITISIAIMPFQFEKERIFQAGISLNRLQNYSDSTIIVDNDSLLENNPELSAEQCYIIANNALYDMVSSTLKRYIESDMNLLCTTKTSKADAESSVKRSLAMLCEDTDMAAVKKAILYVAGGQKLQVGVLRSLVNNLHSAFDSESFEGISMYISNSDETRTYLMASVRGKTKFDKYDPLGQIIPAENVLDWEEMDSSPEIEMPISNLEC